MQLKHFLIVIPLVGCRKGGSALELTITTYLEIKPRSKRQIITQYGLEYLLNTHLHQPIIGIHHTLKANPFHRATVRRYLVTFSIARRSTTPRCRIALHWTLHYWAVVHTHAWTHSPTFEAGRVKVVISPPFVIHLSCYLCRRWCRARLRCRRSGWRGALLIRRFRREYQ